MNKVFLGIGSNIGDREENIIRSLTLLEENEDMKTLECSSLYETKAYGVKEQNNFYNCVVAIETELLPEDLLKRLKKIETETGRKKTFRWGPRVIDIDILYFNGLVYNSEKLRIPHPDLLNRDFFVIPLLELHQNIIHPGSNKKLSEIFPQNLPGTILKKMKFNPLA